MGDWTMHTDKDFCIRYSTRATGRICPITRKFVDRLPEGWLIAVGNAAVLPEAMDQVPDDLKAILADLKAANPTISEIDYAIANLSSSQYKTCATDWRTDVQVFSGDGICWGLALFAGGHSVPRFYGVRAGWDKFPTGAAVLHQHGQFPAKPVPPPPPPPAPVPPPPPTRAEIRAGLAEKAVPLFQEGRVAELLELIREYVQ